MRLARRHLPVRLLLLLPFGLLFACDDGGTDPNTPGDPTGALLSYSDCKYGVVAHPKVDDVDSDTDMVEWSFAGGTLTLTHANGAANCCPDSLTAEITVSGDTIFVREGEGLSAGGCRCLCLYDRVYEIENLTARSYRFEFDEIYLPEGESSIAFDADLAAEPAGSRSVTREEYPWGVTVEE